MLNFIPSFDGILGRFSRTSEPSADRRFYQQLAKEANMIEAVINGLDYNGVVSGITGTRHGGSVFYQMKMGNEKSRKGVVAIGDERWASLFTEARPSGETIPARLDPIRLVIEAPYPGKTEPLTWDHAPFDKLRLGKVVVGNRFDRNRPEALFIDLKDSRSPHVLIAAMTGGGKSVALMNIIASLCLSASPQNLVVYAIDTKGGLAELKGFDSIPHVHRVQDPEQGIQLLESMVKELKRRNQAQTNSPMIIVAIDELPDLVAEDSSKVQKLISRIAQLGRARGIHLIAGAQNPTRANLGTDLIANFPVRLVGAVVDKDASALACGMGGVGAECLPGKGAFYHVQSGVAIRFQAFYIEHYVQGIAQVLVDRYGSSKVNVIELSQDNALSPSEQDARRILDAYSMDDIFKPDGSVKHGKKVQLLRFLEDNESAKCAGDQDARMNKVIQELLLLR
ncbi:MAG: FtsK/SpoIIIE domain-containing protein [Chloroflexota bacterium]